MSSSRHIAHFDPSVAIWVRNGVLIATALVMVVSLALILATGSSMTLLGVAVFTAVFGGGGFGVMLGGVLSSIRAHELEQAELRANRV